MLIQPQGELICRYEFPDDYSKHFETKNDKRKSIHHQNYYNWVLLMKLDNTKHSIFCDLIYSEVEF